MQSALKMTGALRCGTMKNRWFASFNREDACVTMRLQITGFGKGMDLRRIRAWPTN